MRQMFTKKNYRSLQLGGIVNHSAGGVFFLSFVAHTAFNRLSVNLSISIINSVYKMSLDYYRPEEESTFQSEVIVALCNIKSSW